MAVDGGRTSLVTVLISGGVRGSFQRLCYYRRGMLPSLTTLYSPPSTLRGARKKKEGIYIKEAQNMRMLLVDELD